MHLCTTSLTTDAIVDVLHSELANIIKRTSLPKIRDAPTQTNEAMKQCDVCFKKYLNELNNVNGQDVTRTKELYDIYQNKRKLLNREIFINSTKKYKSIMDNNDSKKLWGSINWSGDMKQSSTHNPPPIEELSTHFSSLYEPIKDDGDIQSLRSNVVLPETDDTITSVEMNIAHKQIKKGGYDFPVTCLSLLISTVGPAVLLLMNTILFNCFPANVCYPKDR